MKAVKSISRGVVETTILRVLVLLVLYAISRVLFYINNSDLIGSVEWGDLPSIIHGSFVYDIISILYINLAFIVFSLLPFHFTAKRWYNRSLLILFVATNLVGFFFNVSDIFYYEFKMARVASDDLGYFGEGNKWLLIGSFIRDYFWGLVLWLGFTALATWLCFRVITTDYSRTLRGWLFYIIRSITLVVAVTFSIIAIRGFSISKATFPISMADATRYVKAEHASLILSNPFCLIRTLSSSTPRLSYFEQSRSEELFPITHRADSSSLLFPDKKPNIMIIVLESFGSAHLKPLSDMFEADRESYTPFLDSLMGESMLFTSCFQSGLRSIDAMPAIWASIPTFGRHFLSMPQSVGRYKATPELLKEMGYTTSFHHGADENSLSFKSFGQMAGVDNYYMQPAYEAAHGTDDFDGYWGIWDHKFFPFTVENLSKQSEPFLATLFTLSSHNPYDLPKGFENRFKKGTLEIHELMSYSDYALSELFKEARKQPWFDNTLFIITADHGSGADNSKYLSMPYSNMVPLLLYMPSKGLKGRDDRVVSHIDIMPTILGMVGYDKEYFAFGSDIFSGEHRNFAAAHSGSSYYLIDKEQITVFSGESVTELYDYRKYDGKNIINQVDYSGKSDTLKAYLQNYYHRLQERNYQP